MQKIRKQELEAKPLESPSGNVTCFECENHAVASQPGKSENWDNNLDRAGFEQYLVSRDTDFVALHERESQSGFSEVTMVLKRAFEHLNRKQPLPAAHLFSEILERNPNHSEAIYQLSQILVQQNRIVEAIPLMKRLVALYPEHPELLCQVADLYASTQDFTSAISYVSQALEKSPNNPLILHRLGVLHGEIGNYHKSKHFFQKAASLPGGKAVWRWKHLWFCPTFFENESQIDEYWENLNRDLDDALAEKPLYDWRHLVYDGFTHSFNLPHLNRCCKDVLEKFSRLFAPSFPHERPTYPPGEKIRVGFLVTPGHEGGFLRLESGLIEHLNPEKFEPVLFYNETTADCFEGRCQRKDLRKIPYSWDFEKAVRTIRGAKCDVIYYWKVGADVWNFFLPMCRLAPIQCTAWSTHGTSGVMHVDYYITWDKAEAPENPQEQYTEKLHFFDTKPYFEPKLADIPAPTSRKELGLPETGAIYFCPHRPPKYHPMFDDYLKGILERDANGHIVILFGKSPSLKKCFLDRLRNRIGEELFKRIIVLPQLHVHDYYRFLSVSTVVLNSPIYAGEITAVDAFLYGVPLVTHTGSFLFQRYTSAFYEDFGVDGPATTTKEEYVEQAVKLGTDPKYREKISRQILANHDRFFENAHSVHEWERFLLDAVQRPSLNINAGNFVTVPETAVPVEQLEINVAYSCNLKCNYCSHFCKWMSGVARLDDLAAWFQGWNQKIAPEHLRVIGGEPLLHPKLDIVLLEAKKYWPSAQIDLVTNGLLFPRRLEILPVLKEIRGHVFISKHFNHPEYLREFETVTNLLNDNGVAFTIYPSDRNWRKYYELDEKEAPQPYDSSPEKSWINCQSKNLCPTLWDNEIYKCQHLGWAIMGVRTGKLPKTWAPVMDYRPLTLRNTAKEIMTHLSSEFIPECRVCPETYKYVLLENK